ncbi:hypothetical protein [Clostridium botulinum]
MLYKDDFEDLIICAENIKIYAELNEIDEVIDNITTMKQILNEIEEFYN